VGIDFGDLLDVLEQDLSATCQLSPALHAGDDVSGGHLLAVMERHALTQGEGIGEPIVAGFLGGGQLGDNVEVLVVGKEVLEHLPDDEADNGSGRLVWVEGRELVDKSNLQTAAELPFACGLV